MEFVTIHVTFPLMSAWFSYQLIQAVFLAYSEACPYIPKFTLEAQYAFCYGD